MKTILILLAFIFVGCATTNYPQPVKSTLITVYKTYEDVLGVNCTSEYVKPEEANNGYFSSLKACLNHADKLNEFNRLKNVEEYFKSNPKYVPFLTDVMNKNVKIGFTKRMVELSFGIPSKVNTTIFKGLTRDQMVYRELGVCVYVDNGIVTGIQK